MSLVERIFIRFIRVICVSFYYGLGIYDADFAGYADFNYAVKTRKVIHFNSKYSLL